MKTTVSVRGQTVIPQEIREAMGIEPQTKLEWRMEGNVIVVYPIPIDAVQASIGIFEGQGPTTDELLRERRRERQREQDQERT